MLCSLIEVVGDLDMQNNRGMLSKDPGMYSSQEIDGLDFCMCCNLVHYREGLYTLSTQGNQWSDYCRLSTLGNPAWD